MRWTASSDDRRGAERTRLLPIRVRMAETADDIAAAADDLKVVAHSSLRLKA